MASFGEILAWFKSEEEAENIVAIMGDEDLQNGMIAWKSVRIRFKAATDCAFRKIESRSSICSRTRLKVIRSNFSDKKDHSF